MSFRADIYHIQVRGHLDERWSDWFDGFELVYCNEETILTGSVPDQAALHGILARIRDLGLIILCVKRLENNYIGESANMIKAEFPKLFPRIETERIILMELTSDDAEAIFRNFSDPEISQKFLEQPLTDIGQARQFVEQFDAEFKQGKGFTWAIVFKENNACIGTCGYGFVEIGNRGEIGFDLAKEYWGKGIMSESLKAIIDYGFSALQLLKIEAHTFSENDHAIHLLENLGFQLDHISEDSHYYFLTPKDL